MTLLAKYLFRRNALFLFYALLVGVVIYALTDAVERADIFIDSDASNLMFVYFLVKIPLIVSQILPAVFLLACVVQLCIMAKNRELIALAAGGISFNRIALVLVLCSVFWGGVQLVFSQFVGVWGDAKAKVIWQEQVRKRDIAQQTTAKVWFMEDNWVVSIDSLARSGEGSDIKAYHFGADKRQFDRIITAPTVVAAPGSWLIKNAVETLPDTFSSNALESITLPFKQDPGFFFLSASNNVQALPIWQLSEAIERLDESGSNVNALRTAWHGRLAYAASLIVMAVLATAIVSWQDNIYLAISCALVTLLLSYFFSMMGESLGQSNAFPPIVAAWGPQVLLLALGFLRLTMQSRR